MAIADLRLVQGADKAEDSSSSHTGYVMADWVKILMCHRIRKAR